MNAGRFDAQSNLAKQPQTSQRSAGRRAGGGAGATVPRPELYTRLSGPARVTVVSAPPGSGKTVLLRSWIDRAALNGSAAWVQVDRDERDSRRFWLSLLAALRTTTPGSALVQGVTAAPSLDGWTIVERLLSDLSSLAEPLWLVIDDVQQLGFETLQQLELLVMRAASELRFVLASRHDVRLGLHRLRLDGELTEIRAADLRFTLAETRALFAAASVDLTEATTLSLHERTEGWAAGLRMAALSLTGHPDPERFAEQFSGTERTVAEYLIAEVLDRQSDEIKQLLLRTSVLDRVNGELADLLTGGSGGERMLQDLEQANAFVSSTNATRSWFRYHQMFGALLALELRRTAPTELVAAHRTASAWFAEHGFPLEAIHHAQAAHDWRSAARLVADGWPTLYLDGQTASLHELLAVFPPECIADDAELAAVAAADQLAYGSVEAAQRYLTLAEKAMASVADGRLSNARLLDGIARLLVCRQRADVTAATAEAQKLAEIAAAAGPDHLKLGDELRALTSITLGGTKVWAGRFQEARDHLERGINLARRIGRPYLEFTGLAHLASAEIFDSLDRAFALGKDAIDIAERHGWTDEPAAGAAYLITAAVLTWQGRPAEAEPWLQRAERTVLAETEPATRLGVQHVRGVLELANGRSREALVAFRSAVQLADVLAGPHLLLTRARVLLLHTLVHVGDIKGAEHAHASFTDSDGPELRIATAILRLSQGEPRAAVTAMAPILDGTAPLIWSNWLTQAFLLEAIARDALGDEAGAHRALERALDYAEPGGALLWFSLHPAPGLLERHVGQHTRHAALATAAQDLLAGDGAGGQRVVPLTEPLSDGELRVLRYLPTNLTAPEIAQELFVSPNTVKTHMRNVYAKLGSHRRGEAVARARELGLLAPSARAADR